MAKKDEFSEGMKIEAGKVYVNVANVSIISCYGEYTHVILTNGNEHKYKTAQIVVLE